MRKNFAPATRSPPWWMPNKREQITAGDQIEWLPTLLSVVVVCFQTKDP